MSRIGAKAVAIPSGAKYKIEGGVFQVEGPKGKLSVPMHPSVDLEVKENMITFKRKDDSKESKSYHGLIRNLVKNVLIGVTQGYQKKLDIHGVGFKAQPKGKGITFLLGYSHEINYQVPQGVTVSIPQPTTVMVEGADKVLVGQVAAKIRSFFEPEPYKGKGIRYTDEYVRRKQGKVVG